MTPSPLPFHHPGSGEAPSPTSQGTRCHHHSPRRHSKGDLAEMSSSSLGEGKLRVQSGSFWQATAPLKQPSPGLLLEAVVLSPKPICACYEWEWIQSGACLIWNLVVIPFGWEQDPGVVERGLAARLNAGSCLPKRSSRRLLITCKASPDS